MLPAWGPLIPRSPASSTSSSLVYIGTFKQGSMVMGDLLDPVLSPGTGLLFPLNLFLLNPLLARRVNLVWERG